MISLSEYFDAKEILDIDLKEIFEKSCNDKIRFLLAHEVLYISRDTITPNDY